MGEVAVANGRMMKLKLQTQSLGRNSTGYNVWDVKVAEQQIPVEQTGILVSDMWDSHWSRAAKERAALLAPPINELLQVCRSQGISVIHSPSDTMAFYENQPARQRLLDVPVCEPPKELPLQDYPSPVDSSDHGSDSGEKQQQIVWTRQTPIIEIDQDKDVITGDEGALLYSYLRHRGITNLLYVGVHTNMCILNRSFGIKQMSRWGISCMLVKDLTDSMYNPAMPPYVSHEEGTGLVVAYIEKFWCPTASSQDIRSSFSF
jgi:nicotinamidase-related amidase